MRQQRALPDGYEPQEAILITREIAQTMSKWVSFITFMFGLALAAMWLGRMPTIYHIFIDATISLGVGAIVYLWFYYQLGINDLAPLVEAKPAAVVESIEPEWSSYEPDEPRQSVVEWLEQNVQGDWFDHVDWVRLAEKVALSGTGISRDALSPEVPHFVYSRRPDYEGPTFPEEMVRLGLAQQSGQGYRWTNLGRIRWQVMLSETDRDDPTPLPRSTMGNGGVTVVEL